MYKSMLLAEYSTFCGNGKLNKPANIIEELTVQYWFEKNDVLNHPNEKDVLKLKIGENITI